MNMPSPAQTFDPDVQQQMLHITHVVTMLTVSVGNLTEQIGWPGRYGVSVGNISWEVVSQLAIAVANLVEQVHGFSSQLGGDQIDVVVNAFEDCHNVVTPPDGWYPSWRSTDAEFQ